MMTAKLLPLAVKRGSSDSGHGGCVGATEQDWGKVKLAKLKVQCLLSTICKGDPYTPLKCAWTVEPAKGRHGDIFPLTNPAFDSFADFLRSVSKI
jgi:hypothetical protein